MPADDNVLDLELADGELEHAGEGQVGGGEHVGDVAVDEDVTGLEAEDGGFGDAGVGAAEPEDGGVLGLSEGGEEGGVDGGGVVRPGGVGGEGVGEGGGGGGEGVRWVVEVDSRDGGWRLTIFLLGRHGVHGGYLG